MTYSPTMSEWEAAEKRLRDEIEQALQAYLDAADDARPAARAAYKLALERFTRLVVHGVFPEP